MNPADISGAEAATRPDMRQIAAYVEDMSRELVGLAERADLEFLAYLLELVREEASRLSSAPMAAAETGTAG